jgi:hypothetical protein
MDINVASLEDLKWYREWLREQLDLPLELGDLAAATTPPMEGAQEYMEWRLAAAEARIAVLMA